MSTPSYTITIRVYQTNPTAGGEGVGEDQLLMAQARQHGRGCRQDGGFFDIVEKTSWWSSWGVMKWTESEGQQVFYLASSGACGTLRFVNVSNPKESFLVAVGVHNYKRWCDIVPNLTNEQTGAVINPQYYGDRSNVREQQFSKYSVQNATGRTITINFTQADGQDLKADIIIG